MDNGDEKKVERRGGGGGGGGFLLFLAIFLRQIFPIRFLILVGSKESGI